MIITATTVNLPCETLWDMISSANTTDAVKTAYNYVKINRIVDNKTRESMIDSLMFLMTDMKGVA